MPSGALTLKNVGPISQAQAHFGDLTG